MQKATAKIYGACLQDCIKKNHETITTGPVYVCTCCQQKWFREGVSLLRNLVWCCEIKTFTAQILHLLIMKIGYVTLAYHL